jgi:hypothetical protein
VASNSSANAIRRPAERRTTCVLGGYVRSAGDNGQPVPRAYVGLFQPALADDSPTTEFGQWRNGPDRFPARRQLLTWTYTDELGQFSFDELTAGTYILRAEMGPLLAAATAPQTLVPGEVRAGLDVRLPLAGGLEGRILGPAGVSFEGWRVGLQCSEKPDAAPMSIDGVPDDMIDTRIADDGTFQLGPASLGTHRVWLLAESGARWRHFPPRLPIGAVEIVEGEYVKREFDLRNGFPGSLSVTLNIPMLEREETPAFLRRVPHLITATPRFGGADVHAVAGGCRAGETATIGPLLPGAWSLSVESGLSAWVYNSDRSEVVFSGQSTEVSIEVPLYEATLTCLDAGTGAPLSGGTVMIGVVGLTESIGSSATTDEHGNVRPLLAPGTYSVAAYVVTDQGFDMALGETIEWREDGPHPATVKLLRPATAPR